MTENTHQVTIVNVYYFIELNKTHSLYLRTARCLPRLCQPGQADVNAQNAVAPWFECNHSLQQGVVGYAHCGHGAREHLC